MQLISHEHGDYTYESIKSRLKYDNHGKVLTLFEFEISKESFYHKAYLKQKKNYDLWL